MSHPTAISPEEQEQIARQIGVLLLQGAPEDWQQITVEYRATGEYHDLLAEAVRQDGSAQPWEPPEELLGIFEHLREGMYRPDVGTWLSALYIVERPSSYRIDINFDEEPQWQQPLPRAAYVDELRRYPRSEDNIPDWMRDKLDGTAAPAPQTPASEHPAPAEAAPASAGSVPVDVGEDGTGPLPRTADAPSAETAAGSTHAGSPAAGSPATGSPDGHFRTARVFDGADEQGRPLITTRLPIPPEDSAALRQYLENAPVVLAAQGNEPDQLDPNQPAVVPGTWHTDGVWLWQGAVAYYLAQYGVPPEPELVEHARSRRFGIPEIDASTRDSAASVLLAPSGVDGHEFDGDRSADEPVVDEQPVDSVEAEADAPTASASSAPEDVPTWEETTAGQPSVDAGGVAPTPPVQGRGDLADEIALAPTAGTTEPVEAVEHERIDADAEDSAADIPEVSAPSAEVTSVPDTAPSLETTDERDESAGAKRHGRPDEDDEVDSPDADLIFDDLKDRLDVFGVDRDSYVIGARGESTWSLHDEGSDWVVAGPATVHGPVHFERPEQAAAFLLGSLLMARDPGPAAPVPEPEPIAAADPVEDEVPGDVTGDVASTEPAEDVATEQPDAASSEPPAATEPPPATPEPTPPKTGGNFLFTANETREAEAAEAEAAAADPSLHEQPSHGQAPVPGEPAPGEIRPEAQPPVAPPPPIGQPAQAPPPAAPAANGAPPAGQVPPPLPKRTPRGEHGAAPPPPAPTQQPPAPPAPGGAQGGPDQRRGPAGPSAPGAPPRQPAPQPGPAGAANRPPQSGTPAQQPPAQQAPNQQAPQAAQQQAGQQAAPGSASDQPIQPLHGEPPLTLFRDRRTITLQPGTDIDRFGEPNGNVLYAARTPYNQRSLPPQWANRNYFAYRVQRPLQVLRGTAVPWFEQPGGGTAYVLPAAVGDLVADGTLVALAGADAPPRPPME